MLWINGAEKVGASLALPFPVSLTSAACADYFPREQISFADSALGFARVLEGS